jgi:hypothetical protein
MGRLPVPMSRGGTLMPTVEELIATPNALEAWLNAQPDDALVGKPKNATECTGARFLKALTGKDTTVCWAKTYQGKFAEPGDPRWDNAPRTPLWLIIFAREIDDLAGKPQDYDFEITATHAREALRRAKEAVE